MPRIRSRGAITKSTTFQTNYLKNGSTTSTQHSTSPNGLTEYMEDEITPRFRARSAAGELIVNPMSKIDISCASSPRPSGWNWEPKANWSSGTAQVGFLTPDVIGLRFPSIAFPTDHLPVISDAAVALTEAFANVAEPESQLMVTLGELRQTLDLIRKPLDALVGRSRPFQRLRAKYRSGLLSYGDYLHEAAELWLGWRYGIVPLVHDIDGYVKALQPGQKPQRQTARGYYETSGSSAWSTTAASGMIQTISLDWVMDWVIKYRAGVIYEAEDDFQARVGMRLSDIPTAAWELTTFSFVADWFANTGDFIAGLTAAARSNIKCAWTTAELKADVTATYRESGGKTIYANTGYVTAQAVTNGSGAQVAYSYKRKVRSPASWSQMRWSPRVEVGTKKIIDAFALLKTNFSVRR